LFASRKGTEASDACAIVGQFKAMATRTKGRRRRDRQIAMAGFSRVVAQISVEVLKNAEQRKVESGCVDVEMWSGL
jgi:hypothetical protein